MRAAPLLSLLLAMGSHAHPGLDMDAVLAECTGGKRWGAAEQARRRSEGPPVSPTPAEPALREELLRMAHEDQQARAHGRWCIANVGPDDGPLPPRMLSASHD